MTDFNSQHELDDELLSAYLDGELSPKECAAVEARLAADPAAEQLLHQLRAVSQAMQGLPQEAVGYDLRDAILRKAAQQNKGAQKPFAVGAVADELRPTNGATVDPAGSAPVLTIGRTRRGWIWASLAVAAALLIMVIQREPQDGDDLAHRNRPAAGEVAEPERVNEEPLAFRSLREQAAPATAPAPSEDDTLSADSDSRNWSYSEIAPTSAPPSGAVSLEEQVTTGLGTETAVAPLAQQNQPADSFGAAVRGYSGEAASTPRGAEPLSLDAGTTNLESLLDAMPPDAEQPQEAGAKLGDAQLAKQDAETAADEQIAEGKLVVVRVVARRAALERKEFDRLLESNGIAIDAEAATNGSVRLHAYGNASRFARQEDKSALLDAAEPVADSVTDAGADAEVSEALLVEAPLETIETFLETLHNDTANYVALAVDDATTREEPEAGVAAQTYDFFFDAKEAPEKKLSEQLGWTKFGRGTVAQKKEILDRTGLSLSYGLAPQRDKSTRGAELRGGFGGARTLEDLKSNDGVFSKNAAGEWNRGRARRIKAWGIDDGARSIAPAAAGGVASGTEPSSGPSRGLSAAQRQSRLPADERSTMPVLFVLTPADEASPSEAAPSPAGDNRAE